MPTSPAPDAAAPPGMCPGIVVLGGGGGDGDGDGSGSGGRGGAGGGGKGNGKGGEGDGKSSGTCGPGANGGCTNCKSSLSRGDPVDVVTGEVHTIPKIDFRLPGSFDLEFLRASRATVARETLVWASDGTTALPGRWTLAEGTRRCAPATAASSSCRSSTLARKRFSAGGGSGGRSGSTSFVLATSSSTSSSRWRRGRATTSSSA